MKYLKYLSDEVETIRTNNSEEFYVVSSELKAIKEAQDNIIETQNRNWQLASDQFQALRQNTHHMRNCLQFLYVREQLNQQSLVLSNIFTTILSSIKTYRAALYTFRINLLNSLTPLMNQLLPMSLIPTDQLEEILTLVHLEQNGKSDRLSLAIPITDILSYYETKLVTQVDAIDEGLILTLAIPLASTTTVMSVLHAIPIPMPDGNTGKALVWRLESKYMAISQKSEEVAYLNDDDLANCVGSQKYAICTKAIPTETNRDSCLPTLLYKDDELLALQRCQLDVIELPLTEKASNLGFGRWLITAADDNYELSEQDENNTNPLNTVTKAGCRVCIITLGCGRVITGPNIKLRSDLTACNSVPPVRLDFKLPDPLSTIFELVPPLDDLPSFSSRTEAQTRLLDQVQPLFTKIDPRKSSNETIMKIAKPIMSKLRAFQPKLENRLEQYIPWKLSILFGFVSFIVSLLLHFTYSHLLHKWAKIHRRFPFRITHEGRRIKTKPVQVVSMNDYEYLQEHPEHPLHKCSLVLPVEIRNDFNNCQTTNNPPRGRTPYTFLRDYIRKMRQEQEPTITIEHINRPVSPNVHLHGAVAPSQTIYSHIPDQPAAPHYGAYPMRTMKVGQA